ncbi:hypothetical protein [Priestia megaterium]|uniref:hypothetical protein n=1 Tax=Priestia megaterium TaxID=1404 RepID=UPI0030095DD8
MFGMEQLMEFMKEEFGLVLKRNEVGEETLILYHEEIEKELISEELLKIVPNPVSFHTYIYNEKSEWIIGIALEAASNNSLFLVCLKDGEKIYEEVLFGEKDNEK